MSYVITWAWSSIGAHFGTLTQHSVLSLCASSANQRFIKRWDQLFFFQPPYFEFFNYARRVWFLVSTNYFKAVSKWSVFLANGSHVKKPNLHYDTLKFAINVWVTIQILVAAETCNGHAFLWQKRNLVRLKKFQILWNAQKNNQLAGYFSRKEPYWHWV